jgi:hypothetical protein
VYQAMNGPSEFHVTGSLRTWDVRDRLGEIRGEVEDTPDGGS